MSDKRKNQQEEDSRDIFDKALDYLPAAGAVGGVLLGRAYQKYSRKELQKMWRGMKDTTEKTPADRFRYGKREKADEIEHYNRKIKDTEGPGSWGNPNLYTVGGGGGMIAGMMAQDTARKKRRK